MFAAMLLFLACAENAASGAQPGRSAHGCTLKQHPSSAQQERLGDVISHEVFSGQACARTLAVREVRGMQLYIRVQVRDISVDPGLVWLTWFRGCNQRILEPLSR